MNNFNVIYKILKTLEASMDCEEFDINMISAEALNVSQNRWEAIIEMMIDNKYIKGAVVINSIGGRTVKVNRDIRITLDGLEYLENNSMMAKVKNIARGIKDTIPRVISQRTRKEEKIEIYRYNN